MKFDYDKHENAFLAMRLHRLRTLITEQSDRLFETAGLMVPSPCISVMLFLLEYSPASIRQVADGLGYSHQLINQRLVQLEQLQYVRRLDDVRDRRKCLITLTADGKNQAAIVRDYLPLASRAFGQLFAEIGVDLADALEAAETALDNDPLASRVARLRDDGAVSDQKKVRKKAIR